MDFIPHLGLFEMAIKRVYPDLKFDTPLVIDDELDQDYFDDRKICYFRSTDDFQSIDFQIKRFRNRFFISGTIDKVSPEHIVSHYSVKTAIKIGIRRKGVPDMLEKLDELRTNIRILSEEVYKIRKEIIELKCFSAQRLGLATPNVYNRGYSNHNFPITYQENHLDYVEMSSRI